MELNLTGFTNRAYFLRSRLCHLKINSALEVLDFKMEDTNVPLNQIVGYLF